MIDAVRKKIARRQMVYWTRLSSVRFESERVEPTGLAKSVQVLQISPDMVAPVRVRRVALVRPLCGWGVPR